MRFKVLLEHAEEDYAERAEDHVNYGAAPVFVEGCAGEAVIALEDCLGEEEEHFFPFELLALILMVVDHVFSPIL